MFSTRASHPLPVFLPAGPFLLRQMRYNSIMKKAPVTDHALLRYMERVIGLDVEACKRHMVTPEIKDAIDMGAKSIRQNGMTYIIQGGKIVTVIKGTASNMVDA